MSRENEGRKEDVWGRWKDEKTGKRKRKSQEREERERQEIHLLNQVSCCFIILDGKGFLFVCLLVFKTHFPENMLFGFKKQKSLLLLLNYFIKF